MAICLYNKDPDSRFLLNPVLVYLLSAVMSSVAGSHSMDLFYLVKANFKNLFFDSLITAMSFKNLSYLSSYSFRNKQKKISILALICGSIAT